MNMDIELIPFKAHPLARGGHLQTIVAYYLPGPKQLRPNKLHHVQLPDGDTLVVCENRAPRKAALKKAILLMHGLGGDAESPYMLRLADFFQKRGWHAFRMNHRGAGDGRGLARQIYHSGRSEDISEVLLAIEKLYPGMPLIAVGFSLSGNALLKLLGEQKHPVASSLQGAIAVTPPVDLSLCATALARRQNAIYELRFIRLLRETLAERREAFPDFPDFRIPLTTSLRQFDEICTAPLNGYESAEDYYTRCSARQFLPNIRVPTRLLASDDDPFIPIETFDGVSEHAFLRIHITRGGGHMGFVSAHKTPLGNHRWVDYALLTWAEKLLASGKKVKANT